MLKIAIFSSANPTFTSKNKRLAENIAAYLVNKKITVVTGGCVGLPSVVVAEAYRRGGNTVGYFPDVNETQRHKNAPIHNNDRENHYTHKKFYQGFSYRSVRIVEDVDGAIVFNGRIGTLSEFTISAEEGLKVAVITRTGGMADEIKSIGRLVNREFPKNDIFFTPNYKHAIDSLIRHIKSEPKLGSRG